MTWSSPALPLARKVTLQEAEALTKVEDQDTPLAALLEASLAADADILRSFPVQELRKWSNLHAKRSPEPLFPQRLVSSPIEQRFIIGSSMATASPERQIFYAPPVAPYAKPASRGLPGRKEDPSATISGASFHPPPPPPPLDDEPDRDDLGDGRADTSFDASLGASGNADAKEPSVTGGTGPDYDHLDDSRADTYLPPLVEPLAAAFNGVESGSVACTGKNVVDAPGANGDRDAWEPSVTGRADPSGESTSTQQQQTRSLEGALCGGKGGEPEPGSAETPSQSPDSHDGIDFRRDVGRQYNTNFEEGCGPVPDSVAEHVDDGVQPPRKHRRTGASTATTRATAPKRQAQRATQRSKCRRSQHSIPKPPPSPGPADERPSSKEHVLPPTVAFTADADEFLEQRNGRKDENGIQGDEFEVEEILDSRR
ncbi:hypothetical protein DL770_003912 [Monosporascus sp. CRB-9-2]|nr:hypothetical protein DL770_003912 [Monosporascus sp. CRB-9-2]